MTHRQLRTLTTVLVVALILFGAWIAKTTMDIQMERDRDRQECIEKGGAPVREKGQSVVCLSQPTIPLGN